jgi:hypothetical protein
MLKIIIIIIGYTLNNFTTTTTHVTIYHNIDHGKFNNFKILKTNYVLKNKNKNYSIVETDPRLG